MVSRAAEEGDLLARQAFESVGDWLGVGVANLVAAFDPEVVVVGGGVSAAGDRLLEPARDRTHPVARGRGVTASCPRLVRARFGPEAGCSRRGRPGAIDPRLAQARERSERPSWSRAEARGGI